MTFLNSSKDRSNVANILFGAPMDYTCCFRPGTRFGPAEIRKFSENLEDYSVVQDAALGEDVFYDAGDLELPFGDAVAALDVIEKAVDEILEDGKRPIMLGGEHLVTVGAFRSIVRRFPNVHVIHVDAHFDLRDAYEGNPWSHATMMHHVWGLIDNPHGKVVQIGTRSGPAEEVKFAKANIPQLGLNVDVFSSGPIANWGDVPVYCTFDIDGVDPAFAPGTGTPEAGGLTSLQALQFVRELATHTHLVGFDLVEVSPPIDPSGITSALASNMIRELMIALDNRDIA